MKVRGLILFALAFCFALPSFAANQLRLKGGTIETKSVAGLAVAGSEFRLFIVQWKGLVKEDEKSRIQDLGAKILDYVPEQAFLVKADPNLAERMARLEFVESVVPYRHEWKLDPNYSKQSLFKSQREVELAVELADPQAVNELNALFLEPLQLWQGRTYIGRTLGSAVDQVVRHPDLIWAEEFLPIQSLDFVIPGDESSKASGRVPPQLTGFESGGKIVGVEEMYALGLNGKGQVVAYADTGLDTGVMATLHGDFTGQVKSAWAMASGGKSWADPQAHGTHVAGTIAGSGKESQGKIRGAAWGAQLVVEGMWSDIMGGLMPVSTEMLFKKAFDEGARVHSNSWGRNVVGVYDGLAKSVDQFLYDNPDFLAVFAAGNNGADLNKDGVIDEGSIVTPGTAKNVMTVGASKNFLLEGGYQKMMKELRNGATNWGVEPLASSKLSEDEKGMAAFSSRGPTSDGRIKPEIVAPGTNIVAARSHHPSATTGWGEFDQNYLYMGGTSMATPLTSGSLAILRQTLIERYQQANPSAALLKAFAVNGALDLFPGQFGVRAQGQEQPTARPNNHEGFGRVDLPAALKGNYRLVDERQGVSTGQENRLELADVAVGVKVRATMTYTDAPPAAASAAALVNDLDLEVRSPSGKVYFPNGKTAKDAKNNLEHVEFTADEAGTYVVSVRGAAVPSGRQGKQGYALVVNTSSVQR